MVGSVCSLFAGCGAVLFRVFRLLLSCVTMADIAGSFCCTSSFNVFSVFLMCTLCLLTLVAVGGVVAACVFDATGAFAMLLCSVVQWLLSRVPFVGTVIDAVIAVFAMCVVVRDVAKTVVFGLVAANGIVQSPVFDRFPVSIVSSSALVMSKWLAVNVAVHPASQSFPMEISECGVRRGKTCASVTVHGSWGS